MRPRFISRQPGSWVSRLAWFFGLWAASVVSLFVFATALRALMHLAGMSY